MITLIRSAVASPSSLGLLKFLQNLDVRIVGADITNLAIGQFYCDAFYLVPQAAAGESVIKRYCDIADVEQAQWLVSGPENEVCLLANHRDVFLQHGLQVFHSPVSTLEIITDKRKMAVHFRAVDIPVPRTVVVEQTDQLDGDKVVFKPRQGRGSVGVKIVKKEEWQTTALTLNTADYIAQEYLPGKEYTVDILCDMRGNLLNTVSRERLMTDSGVSVVGRTVRLKQLLELTARITDNLPFYGGNCLQFILGRDDQYYLTDINPRFGGGAILSIKASRSFQKNLCHLLQGRNDLLVKGCTDFDTLTMYRGYEEVYR